MKKDKRLFIFDIEGVLVEHIDEPKPYPYALNLISHLKSSGKKVALLTNIGRKSSPWVFKRLREAGFNIDYEDLFTSAKLMADIVKEEKRRCFVISEGGIIEEFALKNIEIFEDDSADTVVIGACRNLNYQTLNFAMNLLLKGAELFCVGGSLRFRGKFQNYEGEFLGERALAEALSIATGKRVNYIGKPYKEIFLMVLNRKGEKAEDSLMIGDSLESDILGAKNLGIDSVWISHGKALSKEEIKPDFVFDSLKELYEILTT